MRPEKERVATDQLLASHNDQPFAGLRSGLLGFVFIVCGWQTALLAALFADRVRFDTYARAHLISCFALAGWVALRARGSIGDERNSAALQIVAWSAFAGPFGAFVATALAFASTSRSRSSPGRETQDLSAHRPALERAERAHVALLDRRIRLEGASSIRPLIDVIAEGSRSEKLEALRVVYRRYEAGLSAVLKRALQDSDTSVRVLAATVMAKLNAGYSHNVSDRQAAVEANPEAAENWQNLANARLAYAESGLLESQRAQAQIEFAVNDLSRAAELDQGGRRPQLFSTGPGGRA
jgi:hypothetical protein